MELYGYFRSSAAYRLRIALALKGLDYEPHYVSLPKDEHRDEAYLSVNPQGLVPALVDDGRSYTQSLAILEYLEETRPEPPLLPKDAHGRARVRALAQIVACEIHPLNNLRVLRYLQGTWKFSDQDRDAWYRHWIAEGLGGFERTLARLDAEGERGGRYCYGGAVTIADVCLVPQIFNAQRFKCPLDPYPRSCAAFEACMALPAFEQAHPSRQPDATG